MNRAPVARPDYESAAVAAAVVGVALWLGLSFVVAWYFNTSPARYFAAWSRYYKLSMTGALGLLIPVGAGIGAAGGIFYVMTRRAIEPFIHAQGGQLRDGAGAAAGELKREARLSEVIARVAGLSLTLNRIRRSFVIFGAIGGGKTQVIWNLLKALRGAGFRLLVVDGPKGDYSVSMPGDPLIISPWHAGPSWDIAADCPTRGHARELAKSLIPVSEKDPLWGNAAGMIFTAILCRLQAERGTEWGWGDIYEHITKDISELRDIAARFYPPAVQAIADAESKTTQSIVINLTAFMQDVYEMALAWQNTKEKFSFVRWWRGEAGPQVVILQGSGEFKSLAGGYISSIINTLANLTASPSFPESRDRKNMIVIDEMAQLPRLGGVEKFLEIGRSKGCSAIFATQSPAQLKKIYGENDFSAWMSMVGTKVFAQVAGADDLAVAARELGEREVLYQTVTESSAAAGAQAGQTQTVGWQRDKAPVVHESILKSLGPVDGGIAAILAGIGPDPVRVVMPYCDTPALRPAIIENPDFNTHTPTAALPLPAAGAGDDDAAPEVAEEAEQPAEAAPGEAEVDAWSDIEELLATSEAAPQPEQERDEGMERIEQTACDQATDELTEAVLGDVGAGGLQLLSELIEATETEAAAPPTAATTQKRRRLKRKKTAEREAV